MNGESQLEKDPHEELDLLCATVGSCFSFSIRTGNHYFFAEAWVDGENSGLQVSKSRAERSAEREIAGMAKIEAVALRNR
jgi:hypothetical protein